MFSSGGGCSIEVSPAKRRISELKVAAQQHFQRRLKRVANDRQLDLTATLSEAGLQDGDVVLAIVQLGKLAASDRALALCGHGPKTVAETAARCKSS